MFIKRYGNPYEVERKISYYFRKEINKRNYKTGSKADLNEERYWDGESKDPFLVA